MLGKARHVFSDLVQVKQEVPQGSLFGPILFLLYVKGLAGLFPSGVISQYADDISVVIAGESLDGLSGGCSRASGILLEWCRNHNLTLNTKKTGLIHFSISQNNS